MSRWNAEAAVVTLKRTVLPLSMLNGVAKPWMLGSPVPTMSHSLFGDPWSWFSHTTGFKPHVPTAPEFARSAPASRAVAHAIASTAATRARPSRHRDPVVLPAKLKRFSQPSPPLTRTMGEAAANDNRTTG